MANDPTSSGPTHPSRPAQGLGLTVIAAFLCVSLAMTGVAVLIEGLTTGSFGRVRQFGAVSLPGRPVAFAAVAVCYVAATVVTAWGALVLVSRLRYRA